MGQKITAWSYSRWRDYDKCPAYANYKYNMKMKEPPNKFMERGIAIHQNAEDYIKGKTATIIPDLKLFEDELKWLQEWKATAEDQWTLTEKWGQTGWFDQDAWCRIKMDAWIEYDESTLLVIDWKSGTPKGTYEDQMSLYGLGGLLKFPQLDAVEVELAFTDAGPEATVKDQYTQDQVKSLQKEWKSKTKAMLSDTSYRPKPGNACTWCVYSKGKGGPCQY